MSIQVNKARKGISFKSISENVFSAMSDGQKIQQWSQGTFYVVYDSPVSDIVRDWPSEIDWVPSTDPDYPGSSGWYMDKRLKILSLSQYSKVVLHPCYYKKSSGTLVQLSGWNNDYPVVIEYAIGLNFANEEPMYNLSRYGFNREYQYPVDDAWIPSVIDGYSASDGWKCYFPINNSIYLYNTVTGEFINLGYNGWYSYTYTYKGPTIYQIDLNTEEATDLKFSPVVEGTGTVDWGDGSSVESFSNSTYAALFHTYASRGIYYVKVYDSTVAGIYQAYKGTTRGLKRVIRTSNSVTRTVGAQSTYFAFGNCTNLTRLMLGRVTSDISGAGLARGCKSLLLVYAPRLTSFTAIPFGPSTGTAGNPSPQNMTMIELWFVVPTNEQLSYMVALPNMKRIWINNLPSDSSSTMLSGARSDLVINLGNLVTKSNVTSMTTYPFGAPSGVKFVCRDGEIIVP